MAEDSDQVVMRSIQPTPLEIQQFSDYLVRVVPLAVDLNSQETDEFKQVLIDKKIVTECIKKFIGDPQCAVLFIKIITTGKEDDQNSNELDTEETASNQYEFSTEIFYATQKATSVGFIKITPIINVVKKMSQQLQFVTFTNRSPYEVLRTFVSHAMAPYLKSFLRQQKERDREKSALVLEEKLNELEMGLVQLQQTVNIPDVVLTPNPIVAQVLRQCSEKNQRPSVTKLERDPSTGSALQEITFWLNMERSLYRIQEHMTSPEVALTLDVLRIGKRFHATISFESDTGYKEALDRVKNYNILMKDFPINELLGANDLDKIKSSLVIIFNHLKKVRNTRYPINRVLKFIEAISRDLNAQMLKDDEYEKLQVLLRDISKKKREDTLKMVWKLNAQHKKLQARLEQLRKFRRHHDQFRTVIERLLSKQHQPLPLTNAENNIEQQQQSALLDPSDSNAIQEINNAYDSLKNIDILECSPEGSHLWDETIRKYDEHIERVETRITTRLRDQLGKARNAHEMLRIFAQYNALFVRPAIRGAIREYQTQLIKHVKEDIDKLHDKFKVKYMNSKSSKMSKTICDLPPTTGSMIWAKQIERQLCAYLKRVEDVLGTGWENHVDGQRLKFEGDSFKARLNTTPIFDDWVDKIQKRGLSVTGIIYSVETIRSSKGPMLRLKVNFTPEIISLTKEVRNLKWLGFRVPLQIVNKAHQANQLYPYAMGLLESIRSYELANSKCIHEHGHDYLLGNLKKDIQGLIIEGSQLTWESYKLEPYVQRCIETFSSFSEKVEDILRLDSVMFKNINELDECDYQAAIFHDILYKIQKTVDEFCLHDYSNLLTWVEKIDEQIERKLFHRLQLAIRLWIKALKQKGTMTNDLSTPDTDEHHTTKKMRLKKIIHEIRIVNQMLVLVPPFESAREKLFESFFECESIITSQKRIKYSRYQVNVDVVESEDRFFNDGLAKFPDESGKNITDAYESIEHLLSEAQEYFKGWLKYQVLWDLQPDVLYQRLGSNIKAWFDCLNDIRESRKTLDTHETYKAFGPLIIDFSKLQSKINVKYDSWHQDVVRKFGQLIQTTASDFYTHITENHSELESKSVDSGNLKDSVQLIDKINVVKATLAEDELKMQQLHEAHKILERQRFPFPDNWISVDTISNSWTSLNDVMKQKEQVVEKKLDTIQNQVLHEADIVDTRTKELLEDWDVKKPIGGDLKPRDALRNLQNYESKLSEQLEQRIALNKAKQSVKLEDVGFIDHYENRLRVGLQELNDVRNVWKSLESVCNHLEELKDTPWITVQPKKLKTNLEELLTAMHAMVPSVKTYHSYDAVKSSIENHIKMIPFIAELKSEALKDRHWKELLKILNLNWNMNDVTLREVWDMKDKIKKNEHDIRDIMVAAQGEKALEEFLRQIADLWKTYTLELTDYQKKCKVIKSWDDLFTKCKENISNVISMKMSPYYKAFEEETVSWEDKLNRINTICDIWIDVQRRWVYLDGIFSSSADITQLLPNESQKFQSVSAEFIGLLKKVEKSPIVLDVIAIPGIHKLLERLADLLTKIQKALGEYLEKQRASFPRFYFIGDEDLLEMIGNSNNIPRLQKHFKKMFAGVNSLILDDENINIKGVTSREGEEVLFFNPISIVKHPSINDWLTCVEKEICLSLAKLLARSIPELTVIQENLKDTDAFINWLDQYQAQLVVLAFQVLWSENVQRLLEKLGQGSKNSEDGLHSALKQIELTLVMLADLVLADQPPVRRRKLEHLIIEHVHKRDVTRCLIDKHVDNPTNFEWLAQMRLYFDPSLQDRLVQTPLTDRCFLTMTQALHAKFGGSPFGPAGTGKTESVKALGNALGRFVLVFNCDEAFDFQAMGRIFAGLCQVGAWGCFDEFNRLEERMLSAVSQQIQTIQEALKEQTNSISKNPVKIELVGKTITVNQNMAVFITMNPGYAGRSNLPDNLKMLFRSLAMTVPDKVLIAQVMLYSQGFREAESLASKIVPLFQLCSEQLSNQSHYDFGLRSLKSVLVMAGNIKRDRIKEGKDDKLKTEAEQEIVIQAIMDSFVPRLVADDLVLLNSLLYDVFPRACYNRPEMTRLKEEIVNVAQEMHLECGDLWMEKVLQLYQITNLNHGLMLVGPTSCGKTTAWKVLLSALNRIENSDGQAHVIDPKAISKDDLYGFLDQNTREWTDGLFTHILRKIIDNVRSELSKRQWIIFDGDVDPEWVENLNSVLDDNKLLTLPNGERLSLPPNVRIIFEVQNLRYATLATVSRCGMVWCSQETVTCEMLLKYYLNKIQIEVLYDIQTDDESQQQQPRRQADTDELNVSIVNLQKKIASILEPYCTSDGLIIEALNYAQTQQHIMDFIPSRCLQTLFSMLNGVIRTIVKRQLFNDTLTPLTSQQMEQFVVKSLIIGCVWSFSGDSKLKYRQQLGEFIMNNVKNVPAPSDKSLPIIDYEVTAEGEWQSWLQKVPRIDLEPDKVNATDLVIPTIDTIRHEALLYTWLAERKPLLLCGPPGSGKTMTLFSALRALPTTEVIGLNFSCATTPELILKTFSHYCEYKKTPNGHVLAPTQIGKWIIVFCDEINLPDEDNYGTQRVIQFLRQCIEHGGFYRIIDQTWIKLERVQFVGACNPPTDPGRKPLNHRFLRHAPIVYVDYPGEISLKQIYGTLNRAMLKRFSSTKMCGDALTNAMVEFFLLTQEQFTAEQQPHYIYSPREMTRWVRGINEAVKPLQDLNPNDLVRLWAHEALRLFHDRLIYDYERQWTEKSIDDIAMKHFTNVNFNSALQRPILYSDWITGQYSSIEEDTLRNHIQERLKIYYEEEVGIQLVLFKQVLDQVLRIDRVFRQPQGHLLLIGLSGTGKATLCRFVSWLNQISFFQLKVHNKYTAADFDEDLRQLLRRSGCKGEKIVFLLDESNVMDSSFLERMNTLLANGEVPGLFEGDEYSSLLSLCKEGAQRNGLMLDSNEELYKWFTVQVMRNLHVAFTMNPSANGLRDRASTSPALFNRCVLDWLGDWSYDAYYQVASELTHKLDMTKTDYIAPKNLPRHVSILPADPTYRDVITNAFVFVHQSLHKLNDSLKKKGAKTIIITPSHFLDSIQHFLKITVEKRNEIEETREHLLVGLKKIHETVVQVEELQKSLASKRLELNNKNEEANLKLKQMVTDQQEAEKKRISSQELQVVLVVQQEQIVKKRATVMEDLNKVEPAVQEAQQAVKSIKKQNLVELKNLNNPPSGVKLALESVCLLLGEETNDWKSIRSIIMRENFIPTIVNFNTDDLTPATIQKMKTKYLSNPDYSYEKINRASVACGPLVKWAEAQLTYADMLGKVEPLRNELKSLENAAETKVVEMQNTNDLITTLEKKIAQYKAEYADLISAAQAIKTDLSHVESKVERSIALIKNLSIERVRWEQSSESYQTQLTTIMCDGFLISSFLAYLGYFDQITRQMLFQQWMKHLEKSNLPYKHDLARVEYVSSADERLRWETNLLPSDDLCRENAVMLKRYSRYPLIIDPSGQALEFLYREYRDKNIIQTSFVDVNFRKQLESALRFGTTLFIHDAENFDSLLNPVLLRDLRRTGGRVLITIGDKDIDFSPAFTMFLFTRDADADFGPDVCSRVTFVNFTVTRSSLQSQCLNSILRAERPDIDSKRSDLMKLQGEFAAKLRHLEDNLLKVLNESEGTILDNDNVISTLEKIKVESSEIMKKVEETDIVLREVEAVSNEYLPMAKACSSIFFTLSSLSSIHFLYQYSLKFFLEIFEHVLHHNKRLESITDPSVRLDIILKSLFETVYVRVAHGMLQKDRITLGVQLTRIYLKNIVGSETFDNEFSELAQKLEDYKDTLNIQQLSDNQKRALARLSANLKPFKNVSQRIKSQTDVFSNWLSSNDLNTNVPVVWDVNSASTNKTEIDSAVYGMLLTRALKPERLIHAAKAFVQSVFGIEFVQKADELLNLESIVNDEIQGLTPILLCSVPGYDASNRVEELASSLHKQLTSIAIGSAEGFTQAEQAITNGAKSGNWVLLKNVHLAPQWLKELEKKLHSIKANQAFRLFLSTEINPKLPGSLLRTGLCLVFESASGLRASLMRTINEFSETRMEKLPNIRAKAYFRLAWLHALVTERMRYTPLGWSKKYEINESDLRFACDTIDQWIKTNNDPESKKLIAWDALKYLISSCIYGGRLDNSFDQCLLAAFVSKLFSEETLSPTYPLIKDDASAFSIPMPQHTTKAQSLAWVDQLSTNERPTWLGLPDNAETVLLISESNKFTADLLKCEQSEETSTDLDLDGDSKQENELAGRPAWMVQLQHTSDIWLKSLPKALTTMNRNSETIKDPLFRCFEREVNFAAKLLKIIRSDLSDIQAVCDGQKKQTNDTRDLIHNLSKGITPQTWKKYRVPPRTTAMQWISDFTARLQQLEKLSTLTTKEGVQALRHISIWLGGLFTPEAYLTATRQCAAQTQQVSLEELFMDVELLDHETKSSDNAFIIIGLKLQGASCRNNSLHFSPDILSDIPALAIQWKLHHAEKFLDNKIKLPVYANGLRTELLFTIDVKSGQENANECSFYERGVAVLASTLD
ncbi:unnamed protein product [Didymodactylos carnosus]|uniref:Dynein heavy chain, cytoplasmic n=1 Tax=Didymodactylos carnosus TaxID=1234261 RepID=A0A8S2GWM6_9BILA|nr:unnamed protein product [Didymodactylos carnosus]CAF3572129.1 unnamed protein product [Didymodactylos carnosus]